MIAALFFALSSFVVPVAEPTPDPAELVKQLGGENFAEREAAGAELRKLGAKAEAAIRDGLKSDNPEVRARCEKLLETLIAELLRSKDSPAWARFKATAGDDADAREFYLRMVGSRKRAEMIYTAVGDAKKAATIYASECDRIAKLLGPGSLRAVTPDDLAAFLFIGTLPRGDQKQPDDESRAAHSPALKVGLQEGAKTVYARLYAAWAEPRPECYSTALGVGLEVGVPTLAGVARNALAVKDRPDWADVKGQALRFLGLHGQASDIPLVLKFADDKTECARLPFSKAAGGAIGPWWPAVAKTDVVTESRDVAVIAALHLHKKRPQEFGFEQAVLQIGGPPPPPSSLAHLGFCRDADRDAAHKKACEWLDQQKK